MRAPPFRILARTRAVHALLSQIMVAQRAARRGLINPGVEAESVGGKEGGAHRCSVQRRGAQRQESAARCMRGGDETHRVAGDGKGGRLQLQRRCL